MLGARIVQGFGASSAEALGPAVVGDVLSYRRSRLNRFPQVADVYFLHERGTKVGFYVYVLYLTRSQYSIHMLTIPQIDDNWWRSFWRHIQWSNHQRKSGLAMGLLDGFNPYRDMPIAHHPLPTRDKLSASS